MRESVCACVSVRVSVRVREVIHHPTLCMPHATANKGVRVKHGDNGRIFVANAGASGPDYKTAVIVHQGF